LEGWAGLYGLGTPFFLEQVVVASPVVQFILSLIVLLPATVAMGASLPVLSRAFGKDSPWPAVEVGHLYAINTAGAVVGPLFAVFFLFPTFGLSQTLFIAAGADLLVFLGLIASRKTFPEWSGPEVGQAPPPDEGLRPQTALLAAVAVSGATAMVYEVAWTRTLSIIFGSSVYGVSIMLSTFLTGIAAGSALASFWIRKRNKRATLAAPAWLLAGSAIGAFVSLMVARSLPFLFVNLYRSFPERDLSLFLTQFVVSVLLMLPATLCLGAMIPMATDVCASPKVDLGRQVSWLYTSNLLGSTTGTLVAASLLIAQFGIELSVRIASVLGLALALALIAKARRAGFSPPAVATLTGTLLVIVGIDPSGGPVAKGFGFYNDPLAYDQYDTAGLRRVVAAHQHVYYRDGATATVSVQKVERYILLRINGKTDASNGPGDLDTSLMLSHLPLMVSDAKRVALVGWGSGVTAGGVLSHDVDRVDAFEIEPAVVEASHFFEKLNNKPLEDPRLRLIMGDARTRMERNDITYDLIISAPSNPWLTGVANLFTKDFFDLVASRLEPGGLVCQWFHLYGMSEASTRSLLASFRSTFPHVLVFKERDLIMLGSHKPIRFSLPRMRRLFAEPRIRDNLALAYVRYPYDLLSNLRLDTKGIDEFSRGAPLNTDDNMRLELAAPRSLYRSQIEAVRSVIARYPPNLLDYLEDYGTPAQAYVELAASHFTAGRNEQALAACRQSLKLEDSFEGQKLLGQVLQGMGRSEEAREPLENALALGGDPEERRFIEALLRSLDSPTAP
jgi:spermidine synthase